MLDINTKEGYDIAAALRGPDQDYPKLKYIITGWIRAKVGMAKSNNGIVRRRDLTPQDIREAGREVERLYGYDHHHRAMLHWVQHATLAVRWLRPRLTSAVGRRERELTRELTGMLRHPTKGNKDRVLRLLDDWLDNTPKIQVYHVGVTHQRRQRR